ncbi:hypothetical protein O181_105533 [Austropuccinia psidii MF-1]|uniref:Uncharacterized protein n=1 Tax=Austropuccinia psidii MF-1 TaxID=1389203 RepID=A0A9Q3PL32_9BASI|nr:hypothetical protein [Austropuccinia psidii MF-1]
MSERPISEAPEKSTNPTEVPFPPANPNSYHADAFSMLGKYYQKEEKRKKSQLSQSISRHARSSGNPSENTGFARSILDLVKAMLVIQHPSFLFPTAPLEEEIETFENHFSAFKKKYTVHMKVSLDLAERE